MISVDATFEVETRAGRHEVRLASYLDPHAAETAETSAIAWIKSLRSARVDGAAFRDRFTVRGDSLWWFAELYLHRRRVVVSIFQTLLALEAMIEQERPVALTFRSGDRTVARVAALVAARYALRYQGPNGWLTARREHLKQTVQSAVDAGFARVNRLRRPSRRPRSLPQGSVAAFVYTAFWRSEPGTETYLGPILQELGNRVPHRHVCLVGIGPRVKYRQRRWRDRFAEFWDPNARELPVTPVATFGPTCRTPAWPRVWRDRRSVARALLASDDLRRAAVIRGYDAWPIVRDELIGLACLQFPWAARAMDEAGATLDALQPSVALTYAEAGVWGRALILEARRRHIPVVGAQHGFIHRHWLQYLHEPDELRPSSANEADRGFPLPDLTLVYDKFAVQHLVEAGRLPRSAIAVTGSPRLDALVEAAQQLTEDDLERMRRQVGARPGQRLVVLASKYIDEWDRTFAALVRAVGSMPDVHLTMKCHPADARAPYERLVEGAANCSVTGADTSLVVLTKAARLLVTVNSTAAIEAMALDTPALALSLPNYLSPFVEAGAIAGTTTASEIAPTLRALLDDDACRTRLATRRREFLTRYGMNPDGGAARRAADAVMQMAERS